MRFLWVPDQVEHAIVFDPVYQDEAGLTTRAHVAHKLVQVLDPLDALLKELRGKALLNKLELEDLRVFPGLFKR